jgi:small-conductance mechanosensitive channel
MLDAASSSSSARIISHGLTAWDWIHVAIIVAATVALAQSARTAVARSRRGRADQVVARLTTRFLTYIIFLAGFVYALIELRVQIGPLLGALGIGGIALAFALQDTLQNLVAGVLLQARRPFRRGDQVHIDKYEGVVEDIDLRNVALVTFDGLNVFVPNKTVLENPIVNYTRTPTRRTSLTIGVAYGTDLAEVQRLLTDTMTGTPGVEGSPPPAAWVQEFGESSVNFVVLFWHAVNRVSVWKVRNDVAINIARAFDRAGIAMPFPQRHVWFEPDVKGAGRNGGVPVPNRLRGGEG